MNSYLKAKILITGGLGFIGSNLARALVLQGAEVTLVDSLIPQYGGNLFNIDDIRDMVTVNVCDVRDPYAMAYLLKDKDFLFNLAGQTSHMDSMTDPQTDLDINATAEDTLLQLVKKRVKLALLTNGAGESQQEKIKRFGFSRYFPIRLIEGELGFGKPDQRVFETAMKKLETTPGQTWMVGDDLQRDIAGAQKMGIYSIWCDYGRNGLPESSKVKPDKIINNIAELLSL